MHGNGMEVRGRRGCTSNGHDDGMMIVVMPSVDIYQAQRNEPNSQLVQVTTSTSTTPNIL